MFKHKISSIAFHIISWLLFMTLPLLFLWEDEEGALLKVISSFYYWQFCICYIGLFYLNINFLFPRLFLIKRYFLYFLAIVLLVVGVSFLKPFQGLMVLKFRQNRHISHQQRPFDQNNQHLKKRMFLKQKARMRIDIFSISLFLLLTALGASGRMIKQWQEAENRLSQVESAKSKAELQYLKAQVNPHFLFNTLNNIYSLAIIQHEQTASSILKLSKIMHYMTDEVKEDWVSLAQEIEYLQDYIDLQRLRISRKTELIFETTGEIENRTIAPLLFIPFVENAFKYGLTNNKQSVITIRISASENEIQFFCQNQIHQVTQLEERKGVGLDNVKQRLLYLYPDRHLLTIQNESGVFTVNLSIQA